MSIIRLQLKDWLYNAGIVGFVNILKHAGNEVEFEGQEVIVNKEVFEGFEEKYFNYFISTYEKTMTCSKLLDRIKKLKSLEISESNIKSIEDGINYIKAKLKNSAYKNISNKIELKTLKPPGKGMVMDYDLLGNIESLIEASQNEIIKSECTGFYDQKSKVSKSPNAIIDKYINTNMLNINELIDPINSYFEDKTKKDFTCFSCGNPIKKIDSGLSFLNRMFFDTSRKTSHVWNFQSDIEVCPVCKCIYYCVPAGFTTVYGKGIFVNENHNVERAVGINSKIRISILNENESGNVYSTFALLTNSMRENENDSVKYELADIQVVRNEDEKYRFNLLSKRLLKVLFDSKGELDSLIKTGFNEMKTYFRLYDEAMKKLLNNENLFLLIHKAIIIKISKPQDAHYQTSHINNLLKVNINFLKGVGVMNNTEKDILKSANIAGYYLKEAYKAKNSENKLDGISYRLLNALKTNNKHMFMDTLLNCYLYTDKLVPQVFVESLKEDNYFKTVGYAFVSGLIDGKKNENTNGGNNNEG